MTGPEFIPADEAGRRCEGCGHDGPEGHCHLCHEQIPGVEILSHLQDAHPEEYGEGFVRWPDGQVVQYDFTLEPKDFQQDGGAS